MFLFILVTTFLILTGTTVPATATSQSDYLDGSWRHRLQARREDVVRHLQGVPRKLQSRASPTPCSTVIDKNNACCSSVALNSQMECCPQDQTVHSLCSETPPTCCDDGVIYNDYIFQGCCRSPGILYYPSTPSVGCCESGIVTPSNRCCDVTQHVEGNSCVNNPVSNSISKRDLEAGSTMTKRSPHSTRTILSPDLVAEHLVNNGIFTYRGVEHVDIGHRAYNEGALRRLAGRGLSAALKLATRFNLEYDAEKWASMDFFEFSDSYAFDGKDVPEIYARIVAKPDFESFSWRGVSFDRRPLYNLVKAHPGFNASLINQYR